MATQEEMTLEIAKAAAGSAGKESVNKLASVIGGLAPFFGLKRKAVSTYVDDIQKSDLPPETKMMAIANAKKTYKQLKNQMAIAEIAQSAAQDGTDFSQQSGIDDEWLERFMDSARFVSDEEVQLLWGNILAKEFEEPNSTPPSVIRILSEITSPYAKAFQVLCSLKIHILELNGSEKTTETIYVICPNEYEYLHKYGITLPILTELEMLGLIHCNFVSGFALRFNSQENPTIHLNYREREIVVAEYLNGRFPIGSVMLTKAGEAISRFVSDQNIEGHFEAVCTFLKKNGVKLSEKA